MSTQSSSNNVTTASAMGGATLGALGGAAAAVALASGPVGWAALAGAALIGAGAGMSVGGSIGSMFGSKKAAKKKARYERYAAAIQQQRETNAAENQMLQQVREARIARASSVASSAYYGIATSSLTSDATSSIGSQGVYNMDYLAEDRRLAQLYRMYMQKAGSAAAAYQTALATGQFYSALGSSLQSAGGLAYSIQTNQTTSELLQNKQQGKVPQSINWNKA